MAKLTGPMVGDMKDTGRMVSSMVSESITANKKRRSMEAGRQVREWNGSMQMSSKRERQQ